MSFLLRICVTSLAWQGIKNQQIKSLLFQAVGRCESCFDLFVLFWKRFFSACFVEVTVCFYLFLQGCILRNLATTIRGPVVTRLECSLKPRKEMSLSSAHRHRTILLRKDS